METDLSELGDSLARNLWPCATKIIDHFQKKGYKVAFLASVSKKAPYQFHMVFKKAHYSIAVEVRQRCEVPPQLEKSVDKCYSDRQPVKIFVAIPDKIIDTSNIDEKRETSFTHTQLSKLEDGGIGLLIVEMETNKVVVSIDTVGGDKKLALPEGTSLGKHRGRIEELVRKFNKGECLDAFKTLAEIAEGETYAVAEKAVRKAKLALTLAQVEKLDWEGVINALSADNYSGSTLPRVITDKKFSNTLKSHKDKRNLADHKKKAKEFRALEEQYLEAMLEGIRVIRGLIRIKNKL